MEVERWLASVRCIERMVCRVEVPGGGGTGFLIGPDLVLTSFHVVQGLVRGDDPQRAQLVFGETHVALAETWLAEASEERDFAVLRTAACPGSDCVAGSIRGWIEIPDVAPELRKGFFLFVLHHPTASALLLSPVSVDEVDDENVHYRANTFCGSSGSPCFDVHLRLVAMHRAITGGVPIAGIRSALRLSLERSPTAVRC